MRVSLYRWQRLITLMTIFVMLMTSLGVQHVGAVAVEQSPALRGKTSLRQQMDTCFGADVQPSFNSLTGKVNFAGVGANNVLRQADAGMISASSVDAARGYLADCGSLFGLSSQSNELSLLSKQSVPDGRSVVRFQQSYQGIPVFGSQLLVQLTAQNSVILVNGDVQPVVKLNIQPNLAASAAQQAALQLTAEKYKVAVGSLQSSPAQLMVYSSSIFQEKAAAPALVWRMDITPRELAPIRELVLIDAHTGAVAFDINQVDTALNRIVYTAKNTTVKDNELVCSDTGTACSSVSDSDAKAAHLFAGDTYNFYMSHHDRDSIDGAGMDLISTVHYDVGLCNAFWNGAQMTYGDGCAIVVDDVVAHEMTHGVTSYESGLIYFKQQGAINESFSDLWGEFVDQTNGTGNDTAEVKWLLGEDITGIGAFRSMQDPTLFYNPDRMGSYLYYIGTDDNGGVHSNSGVGNKAAYLITDGTAAEPGGVFNGETITGIGIDKTAAIYYEAQTNILTPTSNYRNLRDALNTACATLTGGALGISASDCEQVDKATLATEMDLVPAPAPAPANDLISVPVIIPATSKAYSNTQDIINATTTGDDPAFPDPSYSGYQGSNTVWYKFTPTLSGYLTINTIGSDFDSFISVFTGTPGSLVSKTYNDDIEYTQEYYQSAVGFYASSGETYYIELGGWWGNAQTLVVNLNLSPNVTTGILKSNGTKDGWVLESSETSNLGGTINALSTLLYLGDAAADKQYRVILSFDTSLPAGSKITKATLKIKRPATGYLVGTNPFTWGQGLKTDVCKNMFGTSSNLQTSDFSFFNATNCLKAVGTFGSTPDAYWYSAPISSAGLAKINTAGLTQFRLYFTKDDNDDMGADYLKFYSGNAGVSAPRLVLEYNVP